MKIIKIIILSLMIVSPVCGNLPDDPAEYLNWETGMFDAISEQKDRLPEQAIPKLGLWIFQTNLPNNHEKGERPVFHAAQAALLAIPGHAEYFRNRILSARTVA